MKKKGYEPVTAPVWNFIWSIEPAKSLVERLIPRPGPNCAADPELVKDWVTPNRAGEEEKVSKDAKKKEWQDRLT